MRLRRRVRAPVRARRRSLRARLRSRMRPRLAPLRRAPIDLVRVFGWLYVAVLVPVLLVVGYLVARTLMVGGDVGGSLHMFPLAIIWPLAAVARRAETATELAFPLNVFVLAICAAFVICGWTVLIWTIRDLSRWLLGGGLGDPLRSLAQRLGWRRQSRRSKGMS